MLKHRTIPSVCEQYLVWCTRQTRRLQVFDDHVIAFVEQSVIIENYDVPH